MVGPGVRKKTIATDPAHGSPFASFPPLPLKYISPRLALNCSIRVVFADGANAGRLRPLVANRFRETHFLPRFQVVELVIFDAIAMEVDLPSIRRSNEPVVSICPLKRRSSWSRATTSNN